MKDGNFDIYSMNADGSDWRNMTNHPAHDYWASWVSPVSASQSRLQFGPPAPAERVELHIIYENTSKAAGVQGDHGFACFVTGIDSTTCSTPAPTATSCWPTLPVGVDLATTDHVVVSHVHSDHIGGCRRP
jgi:hypothetical protein